MGRKILYYCFKEKLTNKIVYIGLTAVPLKTRRNNHKRSQQKACRKKCPNKDLTGEALKEKCHNCVSVSKWHKAIKIHGIDYFDMELLSEYKIPEGETIQKTEENSKKIENNLMKQHDTILNGYNSINSAGWHDYKKTSYPRTGQRKS